MIDRQRPARPRAVAGGLELTEYWVCPVCETRIRGGELGMTCDGTSDGWSYRPGSQLRHEPAALERRTVPDYTRRYVRIPAGTRLRRDMRPSAEYPLGETGRTQTVYVNHMGTAAQGHPTVMWAGAGGYWREVRAADVELAS